MKSTTLAQASALAEEAAPDVAPTVFLPTSHTTNIVHSTTNCEAKNANPVPTSAAMATNVTLGSFHVNTPRICSNTVATSSIVV